MSKEERRGGHCDLCHADLQLGETVYVHGTPSTGTYEEAVADKDVAWYEDPHWAACEGCHRRILALDEGQMSIEDWVVIQTKRALRNQAVFTVGMPKALEDVLREEQLDYVLHVLTSFAKHHVPEWYAEVNEGI